MRLREGRVIRQVGDDVDECRAEDGDAVRELVLQLLRIVRAPVKRLEEGEEGGGSVGGYEGGLEGRVGEVFCGGGDEKKDVFWIFCYGGVLREGEKG